MSSRAFCQAHAEIAKSFVPLTATIESCAATLPKTVDEVGALAAKAKTELTSALEGIYNAPPTFEDVARTLDCAQSRFSASHATLAVGKNVYVDKDMRDAASKAIVELSQFSIDNLSSNRKLYKCLEALKDKEPALNADAPDALKETQRYWYEESLKDYQRQGMHLGDAELAEVVALQKELSELSNKFSTNCAEDKTTIEATEDEVKGVPASIIKGLKKTEDGAKYILGMDYPTYFGVMKNCEVAATRKAMSMAFENRGYPANEEVLQKVIATRHLVAQKLGYKSYSHYDLENKMAKSPDTAHEFIKELIPGLQKKWQLEKAELLKDLHPSVQLTESGDIPFHDVTFCMTQYKDKHLNVNEQAIQEYFPMDATVAALFAVYERFFDISFERCDRKDLFWHDSVTMLTVRDNKGSKPLLGHIALDLFPREGKYTHACCHGMIPAVEQPDGTFSAAMCVVIANFPAASGDRPALLLHDDVETFFHEFGHAIHGLCGRTQMSTHAGTRVKRDFVELPSQMLEEWLWEDSILEKVSQHFETKKPLPSDLIAAKIRSKTAFSGRDSLRQLTFATYALELFSAPDSPAAQLYRSLSPKILPGVAHNAESHFECAFGHLMGYGACYYGYMWSEVFAQDVFEYIRARDGLLSPVLGQRYVQYVIGPGGSRDPSVMLEEFLERKPTNVAFLKKLGLETQ